MTTKNGGYLIERPHLENHPWILGVKGSPFEMGFQQGYLMSDLIRRTASGFLSPIFAQFGGWQPESGQAPTMEQMEFGRAVLGHAYKTWFEPALKEQAPDLLEEMQGIADGLREAGADIPAEDIFIGNCVPEITELVFYLPDGDDNAIETKGCSDCVAWGAATEGGSLVHGTNYDYATFNILHKGIGIIVAKPDSGQDFLAQCLAGTVGHYRGMNVQKMTIGESTSDSADRDIKNNRRIPHAMQLRHLIQHTTCLDDAIRIMKNFGGGTTGYNHAIGDGKVPSAIDIEASCTQTGILYPQTGFDAICNTNHFKAYPGFNGYDGENLTIDQLRYWKMPVDRGDTMENWQAAAREETDRRTLSWQRYEKLVSLVTEHYGNIDVDNMLKFMSSWPMCREQEGAVQLAAECEQLYGQSGPISDMKLASIFSAVFDTAELTAWVAVGGEPAQAGMFWPVNLETYLKLLDDPDVEEKLPDAGDGKRGSSL